MSLTVCLLTRNEENTVARAIRSVHDVAEEVLVADTASSDGTGAVAGAAGADVSQFVWEDDFSAGRNHLIERAKGDRILWLDAKEELTPASVEPLRECLARDDAFGFFVRIRHVGQDGRQVVGETADLRLMRRRPDLRFVGRLHPHLEPAVVETVKREGRAVEPCEVVLVHHVDAQPPGEGKLRWTSRLLELELRDRPGQLHYLIEHGRTLLLLGDPRGRHAMSAAADQVRASREASRPPSAKVQVLLHYILTSADDSGQPGSAISRDEAGELALRWFPDSPALLWAMAEQRFLTGEFERAANLLERLVRLSKTGTFDRSQHFSPDLVGERAILNLGVCHLKLNRPAEAEACFLQLVAHPAYAATAARELDAIRRARA